MFPPNIKPLLHLFLYIARHDLHGADTGHVDDGGIKGIGGDFDAQGVYDRCAGLLESRLGEGGREDDVFRCGAGCLPVGVDGF